MYIESFLELFIPYITGFLETIGVIIITVASIKAIIGFVKSGFDFGNENLKIELAKALALSLEFKLAAEILKTVIIRTLDEFLILAAITFLRIIISFVIHWEVDAREKKEITSKEANA
ncbi:DUF1622 domain-containing protein [Clostridium sp. Cult1]|uniref:DUF1622 domain-containing protein n=1 Tax=Clostridium sp. Cult1 TaxID=2079002 RepID=UPI001F246511|nr:DUF1622 domain-containing protein [Clostridium sp. Cult1]MCF6463130.1 hypothetical protein [Clostridium sp. Cult1]